MNCTDHHDGIIEIDVILWKCFQVFDIEFHLKDIWMVEVELVI